MTINGSFTLHGTEVKMTEQIMIRVGNAPHQHRTTSAAATLRQENYFSF